jgi:hypothetical protein
MAAPFSFRDGRDFLDRGIYQRFEFHCLIVT